MKVNCGKCTVCCQWGGNDEAKVRLTVEESETYDCLKYKNPFTEQITYTLDTKKNGDCIYLDREKGCTIHDSAPIACQTFDCRKMLDDMLSKNDVYINVIVAAVTLRNRHQN